MGEPRIGPLAAMVVMLVILSGLGPLLVVSAAPVIAPDTVYRGTLGTLNERDDYNFTAGAGKWTVIGSNIYQGTGTYNHGLRTDISSKSPIAFTPIGSFPNNRRAGVIAINGHDLPGDTLFTVSQQLTSYSPSYALQLRTNISTLSHSSQTVSGSMGVDGIVTGFAVDLVKRDTIDLRLRIPPEWTYNYHFSLLLFGPNGRYHHFEGSGGNPPVAESSSGENSEQALTYVAMDPGSYLIVMLNEGVPDNIVYDLDVRINGLPLADGDIDEDNLTKVNTQDFYRVTVPTTRWSAAVVKARGPIDRTLTHSLHWPTPDSNSLAFDELSDEMSVGIIAINGEALSFTDTYYVKEAYSASGTSVPFTIQFAVSYMNLPPGNSVSNGSLEDTDIFQLYEIDLQASQTADFRLRVGDDYNYDYDLGMYIFPPGEKYYSISGQRPEYAGGPIAWSRNGPNLEQDAIFTAPSTGTYALAVVNFAPRDEIPFTLEVTVQGKGLADDRPQPGDLNDQNRYDLYQFLAQPDEWNVVGTRAVSDEGSYLHSLHRTSLDTNAIRVDEVGYVQVKGAKHGTMELKPLGLIAVNGRSLVDPTTYYVKEEVATGSPSYVIEMENSPRLLTAQSDNVTGSFGAAEFLRTYTIDLDERDTIDLSVSPPEGYSYPYQLGIYVLAPGTMYRNLETEGDVAASSVPGERRDPTLMYTASVAGEHLIVVANLGTLGPLDYELLYAVDGFPTSTYDLSTGVLDEDNIADAFRFDASPSGYTMVVVRLPGASPPAALTATLRWPTVDSVPLATLVLTKDERVGAFVIDGATLPAGDYRHYVLVEGVVPEGRTLTYQIQVGLDQGSWPPGAANLTGTSMGALYSPQLGTGSTADISLRMPPSFTYTYDLGLYVFAPTHTYMSTNDAEAGPAAWCSNGPGTEQEIVYTSSADQSYAVVVLNQANLGELQYILGATVDGRPLDTPKQGYVDGYNRNEQYRFTASQTAWSALAAAYVSGGGTETLKLLTEGLYTNPVAKVDVGPDTKDNVGVIAIHGWGLDELEKTLYVNVSQASGVQYFVVHADTNATDFGPIGHVESGRFAQYEILHIYSVDLTVGDSLDIQLAYDQGNWSSDVYLELQVFEPSGVYLTDPAGTVALKVADGDTLINGKGNFVAEQTGRHAFVLVNRGPLGAMGFSMGVYRKASVNLPPSYPAVLKASSNTDSITIEWAPNQQADFDRYEIYLSSEANEQGKKVDTISNQAMSKYTITGLDPGHKYYVTIVTYDTEGLYTASNPYALKTKELPLYAQPTFWVVVLAIVVAVVFIIGFDWFIRRQKAAASTTTDVGATGETPGEPGIEVETIEAERPSAEARRGPEDERTADRREAVDFMKRMMGDEE